MKIHKEGIKIIPIAFFTIAVVDVIIYIFLQDYLIYYLLMAASVVLAALVVYFFRIPKRVITKNEKHVLAPADGKVVEVKEVIEEEYFKDKRLQISIFMSPLNVHQNRSPIDGEITFIKHHRGAYYPAFVEKSSHLNERCTTVFKTKNGVEVLARQIAGTMARRICNYKKPGDKVEQGAEYGFIRFGSRVDVFLPPDAKVLVEYGLNTVGGKTVLAEI